MKRSVTHSIPNKLEFLMLLVTLKPGTAVPKKPFESLLPIQQCAALQNALQQER